ncbi:Pimeloyl-ACP methyl ester carboxylesterase [Aliiroseovarius halocynthiae]|uniref:Alpha/beta hydrolase n=1 Tax=Aliiroseovarius halocynthiae TaxID=985055 RepID=A0A545SYL3_9RHOB|nr:alpha/beta fold hydrolase [Aliiroseovarius halocynthiae]TQV70050.1 alpha/beta hydrolase [Aliiroseovarius halocynthiae]SMR70720.1 Pimeloyl-ACP methyl ester carboxylesterase [Aliiroseovarius halocynthiae]
MLDVLGGCPTFWDTQGAGPREALFIHCSLAHSGAWRAVRAALGRDLTSLAYDLPGHGRSADWDGQGDYQDAATQVALELLSRHAQGPVDLVGHSFGGTIALRVAQMVPNKVRSLTLFEPVLFTAAKDHPAYADNHRYMNGVFADAMRAGDRMEAARLFNCQWGGDAGWDALPARLKQDMADRIHLIPAGRSVTHEDRHGQVAPGALENVTLPVLLLEGQHSPDLVRAVHDQMQARFPNVRRQVIAGAGHMGPISHAQEVSTSIRDHILQTVEV